MKIHLLGALIWLTVGFGMPVYAQPKDTADPQTIAQLKAFSESTDQAFNNGDAAALAALYTQDAILVTDGGPIYGRDAIEKHWADAFKQVHFSNHLDKADEYSPHIIGTAGNEAWSSGKWTVTLKGQDWGPKGFEGYWLEIYRREGDTWKKRLDMYNVTPAPAAPPSPTASPSSQ
jgi:ketosteroid isomerase-like protein